MFTFLLRKMVKYVIEVLERAYLSCPLKIWFIYVIFVWGKTRPCHYLLLKWQHKWVILLIDSVDGLFLKDSTITYLKPFFSFKNNDLINGVAKLYLTIYE